MPVLPAAPYTKQQTKDMNVLLYVWETLKSEKEKDGYNQKKRSSQSLQVLKKECLFRFISAKSHLKCQFKKTVQKDGFLMIQGQNMGKIVTFS